MGTCPVCRGGTGENDRFCARCGTALDSAPTSGPVGPPSSVPPWPDSGDASLGADADVQVLDLGPDVSTPDSVVRRAPSLRFWGAIAAGVLGIVIGLWALGRAGESPPAATPAATTLSPTTSAVQLPTAGDTTTTVRTTTAGDPDSTGNVTTTTTVDTSTSIVGHQAGPVLGRRIGWSMFIGGGYDGGDLRKVDLDTGIVTTYPGVRGQPVSASERFLVLDQQPASDGVLALRSVPLDDPAGPGHVLAGPGMSYFDGVVPTVEPAGDRQWIALQRDTTWTWALVNLEDGATLDEAPGGLIGRIPVPGGGPDVASSGSGGVYIRQGDTDTYRQMSSGMPLAATEHLVLVRTCTSPVDCTVQWLDRVTWKPVDRPVPDASIDYYFAVFGGGRYILEADLSIPTGPETRVFDAARGETHQAGTLGQGAAGASRDGRYLAAINDDGLVIEDPDHGTKVTVSWSGSASGLIVFVPNH